MSLHRRLQQAKNRRAFLLPLALAFLFVLLLLELGLVSLQQTASQNALNERSRLAHLVGTEEVYANLGRSIETGTPSGSIGTSADIAYNVPQSELVLSARWGGSSSSHRPLPSSWATFDNVLKRSPGTPEFSFYTENEKGVELQDLPPGHTRVEMESPHSRDATSVATFSHTFPYGIYAPNGSIVASAISSFANPVEYESKDSTQKVNEESGRPVDILAGQNVTVSDYYSSGRALSGAGSVSLPEGDAASPGAVGFSGRPLGPNPWTAMFDQLTSLGSTVASGSLDKTEFLDDELFTLAHLKALFSGDASVLESIFSVGQACKVPFFPIPATQDDVLLFVFYIHHPYPVDFSGTARNGENSEKLKELNEELEKKQEELEKKEQELSDEEGKEKPDQSKIDSLNDEISDLNDDIKKLKKQIKELSDRIDKDAKDIGNQISQSNVPETAGEDAGQVKKGWAYTYILSDLLKIVLDLIKGKDPLEALVVPSRVVHFGDKNPDWSWGGDSITMKANLTVPRGRTLKLSKGDITVSGDVYLQEGAVLQVTGNLTVEVPAGWTDFKGVPASSYGGFPNGRLIMDEGSSVVVGGNLKVEGGSSHEGSVLLSSEYGPNKALTRLIQAGGDIELRHGMTPAVELGDLVDALADKDSTLKGFNEYFFRPLTEDVFTVAGKMPYIGPWQSRTSWFASYATTFEFLPELEEFGLGGPWPIPLPYDNCLVKVFNYLSIAYSVELNASTGENFYTHSPYWLFGRGVTPVFLKINPELVRDELRGLDWEKISVDAIKDEMLKFLKDEMPKFAANIVQNIITEVIKRMVESLIPFKPPSCGSGGGSEETAVKELEEVAKEFAKDVLKEFAGILKVTFQAILVNMKNKVYDKIGESDEYSVTRQLPGVAVAAGGNLSIGQNTSSKLAMGLLIAKKNVTIASDKTIGTVISLEGDVVVDSLLHYPYFDRVSLYEPKKHVDLFSSIIEITDPEGSLAGDVSRNFATRLAEGWK